MPPTISSSGTAAVTSGLSPCPPGAGRTAGSPTGAPGPAYAGGGRRTGDGDGGMGGGAAGVRLPAPGFGRSTVALEGRKGSSPPVGIAAPQARIAQNSSPRPGTSPATWNATPPEVASWLQSSCVWSSSKYTKPACTGIWRGATGTEVTLTPGSCRLT